MTNIILSTVCALALNAASLSAQADTADIYLIDYVKVENFNGSQLARKVIYSYTIRRRTVSGVPTRLHFINTGVMKNVTKNQKNYVVKRFFPFRPEGGSAPDHGR